MRLGDATWNDVERVVTGALGTAHDGATGTAAAPETDGPSGRPLEPVVLIPVGSTEQHGPHLPLSTDTLIAEEIAGRAVHLTEGLMIGPTISVSASGEHAGFPGTLSIGNTATTAVVVELARSADWSAGVVFVNGHGGNHAAMTRAVDVLTAEGRQVLAWWPKWPRRNDGGPADLHAGRIETSLMLAIDPGLVRLELAARGADTTMDELREQGVRVASPSGVLGDPTGASGGEGERFITWFVDDLVHKIERWRPLSPTPPGS